MNPFEDLTRAVTVRHSDQIQRMCAPLFEYFHLSHFGYCKLTEDGFFRYLGSHVAWSEYFAAERLYLHFPYYRHPKWLKVGMHFTVAKRKSPFSEILDVGRDQFGMYHKLFFLEPVEKGVEGFCFATGVPDWGSAAQLLNEVPLLRYFIQKFKRENKKLLALAEERRVNLVELMGGAFYQKGVGLSGEEGKQGLLKSLGIEGVQLSEVERMAMRWIREGFSAREIGVRLFRSKRTVEHLIERLKEKLDCGSKGELIRKAKELEGIFF